MKRNRTLSLLGILAIFTAGAATAQLGELLKGGGIAFVVSKFGPEMNRAINALTHTENETAEYATKVVPIVSVGQGKEVGAAQVMGPNDAVKEVSAVAQLEGKFGPLGMRLRALIPVHTKSFTNIKRITGVGISGLVDIKL